MKLFIHFYFCLFSCNLFLVLLPFILSYRKKNYCLSLIIPSTNNTWKKCKHQIERMICKSIELPHEVIIVISNSFTNNKKLYNTYCNYILQLYYRKGIKNSAANKNYGTKKSKCNIISYFDGDDVMSRYRIKVLHMLIDHNIKYDVFLHMYTKNYSFLEKNRMNFSTISQYIYSNSSHITNIYKRIVKERKVQLWGYLNCIPKIYHISNGWITIKRELFERERFNEDISIQRAEDSEFNGRVISKGYKALYILLKLGFYSKQNQCLN